MDIADPIITIAYLFSGAPLADCDDACDTNDDGGIDIGDAIYALSTLFSMGANPPPPFVACGSDPTGGDSLDCASFLHCP